MVSLRCCPKLFEVFCKVPEGADTALTLTERVLVNQGILPQDIVVSSQKKILRLSVYLNTEKKACKIRNSLNRLNIKGVRFYLKSFQNENWKIKWAKDLRPFRLTKKIDVVPTWHQKGYARLKRQKILLSSVNAFGTGLHETTRFMAQLLEEKSKGIGNFLDIGTGTGLLALVALRCDVKDIVAIDNDKDCIAAAKENFRVNGFSPKGIQKKDIADFKNSKKFNYIAANLISHDLMKLKQKIYSLSSSGGFIAISGISLENLNRVRKAYRTLSLRCVRILKGKQWAALLYQRKK